MVVGLFGFPVIDDSTLLCISFHKQTVILLGAVAMFQHVQSGAWTKLVCLPPQATDSLFKRAYE